MEIHLDLVGGLAGDMFIAALLDAQPEHEQRVKAAISMTCGARPVSCALVHHKDEVLRGRRFDVSCIEPSDPHAAMLRPAGHDHVSWRAIRSTLTESGLPDGARHHALKIFEWLADAEGFVHGIPPDDVQFHEVGAWDSIADIVGAATLIDALGVTRWTSSPVPLGTGRVATAHGMLPVPAPATTRLLLGMATLDDGVPGERVTPTGAAILRHLCPPSQERRAGRPHSRTLIASGTGFGSRRLPGLSNHVRALCFDTTTAFVAEHRRLNVIEFEVDDQSGEELAMGLDHIRAHAGVLDVIQAPVFGKKGRMMAHIRVLARYDQLDAVVNACFLETTTIGLRHQCIDGIGLERIMTEAAVDSQVVRVKVAERPGRRTAKAEADDVTGHAHHQRRALLRRLAETAVLDHPEQPIDA